MLYDTGNMVEEGCVGCVESRYKVTGEDNRKNECWD